ncbi:MAG: hypothetical protein ABSC36_00330 [Gaiellaceae bacterium]|jgi:hypothetical protein
MSLDKISTGRRVLLGAALVLFIWSFFSWNGVGGCVGTFCVSVTITAWHGWGTGMGIVLIVLLLWEAVLLAEMMMPETVKLPELPVKPIMITLGLGALTVLFGVIRVFEYGARKWEIWIALLLLIALAVGLFLRVQEEGGAAAVKQ